jgi:hypothetical protein
MPDLITWKNLFTKGEGRLKKIINTARKGQQLNAIQNALLIHVTRMIKLETKWWMRLKIVFDG